MLESLIAFTGAAVLIAVAPGPSTVVIMRQSLRTGRRGGLATVLGNEAGVLVWGLAAAVGLSALLAASRLAYDGLRVAGAAVLVWFGVRALWRARRGASGDGAQDPGIMDGMDAGGAGEDRVSGWRCFRLGLVTNVANPKAGVFAVSFLPQFVPDGWSVPVTLAGFSVLWALIDLAWYAAVVWLVGSARRVLGRPVVRRRLEQLSGVVLVGLGVRLAAEAR
ncbi:LysE family translocator [Actinomadura macra]|uniref:LysE family translocator n=1 Tax=Actinomadura macra TaxID=46164 RepID=UPI0008320208|nr:LysE family translocator [Actinomadura macra]